MCGPGIASHVRHLIGLVVGMTDMTMRKEVNMCIKLDGVWELVAQRVLVGSEHAQAVTDTSHC